MEKRLRRLDLLMKDESFDWPPVATTGDEFNLLSLDPSSNQEITAPSDSYSCNNASDQVLPPIEINWPAKNPRRKSLDDEQSNDHLLMMNAIARDPQGRALGQLAEPGAKFCPIMAVSKFPYWYMDTYTTTSAKVSEAFFAAGKFFERQWTIYYIYVPDSISYKPLLLVSVEDVELFLMEVNRTLGLKLGMPTKRGFVIDFTDDGSPRPRFLGISSSRVSYDAMEMQVPTDAFKAEGEEAKTDEMDEKTLEAFKAKMELAVSTGKKSAKGNKKKKKDMRVQRKIDWFGQLRRLQRYLGLQPISPISSPGKTRSNPEEFKSVEILHENLAPYPFNEDVVFISVDVESYEKAHQCITEIGISSLDTRDLVGITPGKDYENWKAKIRARHFRTLEYLHLINDNYIIGCGDKFEKSFGESEFITLSEAPGIIASCFRPPFSAQPNPSQERSDVNHDNGYERRNIVLVGHDTKTDIAYLRTIGYDPANLPNMVDVLDTAELFKAMRRENQPRSLGGILVQLDITGWNLHNAGNDAAYTLQALVTMGFQSLFPQKHGESMDRQALLDLAIKEAEERIAEDNEEWEKACGSDDGEARPFDFKDVGPPASKHRLTNSSSSNEAKVTKDFNRDRANDPEAIKKIAKNFAKSFQENAAKAGIKIGDPELGKGKVNGTDAISELRPIKYENAEVSDCSSTPAANIASIEDLTEYYMSGASSNQKKPDPVRATETDSIPCYWDSHASETRRARIETKMEEIRVKREVSTSDVIKTFEQNEAKTEDASVSDAKDVNGASEGVKEAAEIGAVNDSVKPAEVNELTKAEASEAKQDEAAKVKESEVKAEQPPAAKKEGLVGDSLLIDLS